MKIMIKGILPAIGVCLMIAAGGCLIYFNVFTLLYRFVQTPLGYAYLSLLFTIIGIVIPCRIRRAVDTGDERLQCIHYQSTAATLYWLFGSLLVAHFHLQSRGLQGLQVALGPLLLIGVIWLGGIYCITFAYYYFKMS